MANWWDAHKDSEGFKQALAKFGLTIEGMNKDTKTADKRAKDQNDPVYWLKRTLEIYGELDKGIYNIPVVEWFDKGKLRQGYFTAGRHEFFPTNISVKKGDKITIKWSNKPENVECYAAVGGEFVKMGEINDFIFFDRVDESGSKKLEKKETTFEPAKEGALLLACVDGTDVTNKEMEHIGKKVRIEVLGGNNNYPIYIFGVTPAKSWSEISKKPNSYGQVQMFDGRNRMYATKTKAADVPDLDINEMMREYLLITTLYDYVNGLDNSSHLHSPSQGLQVVIFPDAGYPYYANNKLIALSSWDPDKTLLWGMGVLGRSVKYLEADTYMEIWHEFGHQSQLQWTWLNQTEVTVNIYAYIACMFFKGWDINYYKCDWRLRWPDFAEVKHISWADETVQNFMAEHKYYTYDFEAWSNSEKTQKGSQHTSSDDYLLRMYIQLASTYGISFYVELGKALRKDYDYGAGSGLLRVGEKLVPGPFASDDNKKDWFVVNSCRIAQEDLRPFFDLWKFKYSQAARDEIGKLKLPLPGGASVSKGKEGGFPKESGMHTE